MYKLVINRDQAKIIALALDFFSRIGCGQIEEILRHPSVIQKQLSKGASGSVYDKLTDEYSSESRMRCHEAIRILKEELFGYGEFESTGIPAAPEINKIAHDICQVVSNRIAWDETPTGGNTVDFQEPLRLSVLPLPTIE